MVLEEIAKRFKKKIIETKIEEIKFKWEFEDLFEILNLDNFITMMQYQLKTSYNFNQEQDIKNKFKKIRFFIENSIQEIKNIDVSINDLGKIDNLIHMMYMEIKDVINDGMIKYLFFEKIHSFVEYKDNLLDTDDYFHLKFTIFQEKLFEHFETFKKSLDRIDLKRYSFSR